MKFAPSLRNTVVEFGFASVLRKCVLRGALSVLAWDGFQEYDTNVDIGAHP